MTKCYICESTITKENETEEHIILNSLGGKLKSKTLICRNCNSKLGNEIDSELSDMLNPIANLLNIDRDRGRAQAFKVYDSVNGETYNILPGGKPERSKPVIDEEINNGRGQVRITARSYKEARHILKGYKKKYKDFTKDIDDVIKEGSRNKTYITQPINIDLCVGNNNIYKAICKMAINFYIYVGGNSKYIKHLIPYILGENNEDNYTRVYYKNSEIVLKNEEILHSLIIKGDNSEGILFAYIELFNVYKYVVLLNESYSGEDIEHSYLFNVVTREKVNNNYNLSIKRNDIIRNLNDNLDIDIVNRDFDMLFKFIEVYNQNRVINNILNESMKSSFDKHPENSIMTMEMLDEFLDHFSKEFVPFLSSRISD